MTSSIFSRTALIAYGLAALLVSPACTTRTTTPPPLVALDYAGDKASVVALDSEIAAAGQDATRLEPIAARLLQTLRDPAATPAARQAIAQRLTVFPAAMLTSGDNALLFRTMLADEQQVNLARLALDRVPGDTIDALYLQALDTATGAAELALVQSIGNRRIAGADAALARRLDSSDAFLTAAAAKALGQIGTTEALAALRHAPNPAAADVVAARLAVAETLGGAAAAQEFRDISAQLAAPAHHRAAAIRGLLFADPSTAPERFASAIGSGDAILKPVVIEAIATHPSDEIVPALAAQLATWDAPTQEAVITALGRRGDPTAVPAISEATRHDEATVRAAAIVALGRLRGSPEIATLLAGIATGDNSDDAKLARSSLAQLDGPGVADAVLTGAALGENALREVFLEQIASRNMTSAVPLLLKTRSDPDAGVRAAALGSLAEIAPASEQAAILEWAVAATGTTERSRALRALANVTLRDPNVAQRSLPVITAIEQAPPEVALRLLPVLPRIGGEAAAQSAAKLALRNDPALSDAAATTLGRWTDSLGLQPLVEVAENTSREQTRAIAVRSAAQYLTRLRDLPPAELVSLVTRLLEVATDDTDRGRLAYLLSRCREDDALALAEKLAAQPSTAAPASDAVLAIRANRAGAPVMSATSRAEQLPNLTDGKPGTRWAAPSTLGQSIQLDFHSTRPVRQVVLDGGTSQWGYPDQVEILVTDDPKNPGPAVASAAGQPGKMTIDLPADTRGRYLIIRHASDKPDDWWGIAEVLID